MPAVLLAGVQAGAGGTAGVCGAAAFWVEKAPYFLGVASTTEELRGWGRGGWSRIWCRWFLKDRSDEVQLGLGCAWCYRQGVQPRSQASSSAGLFFRCVGTHSLRLGSCSPGWQL